MLQSFISVRSFSTQALIGSSESSTQSGFDTKSYVPLSTISIHEMYTYIYCMLPARLRTGWQLFKSSSNALDVLDWQSGAEVEDGDYFLLGKGSSQGECEDCPILSIRLTRDECQTTLSLSAFPSSISIAAFEWCKTRPNMVTRFISCRERVRLQVFPRVNLSCRLE